VPDEVHQQVHLGRGEPAQGGPHKLHGLPSFDGHLGTVGGVDEGREAVLVERDRRRSTADQTHGLPAGRRCQPRREQLGGPDAVDPAEQDHPGLLGDVPRVLEIAAPMTTGSNRATSAVKASWSPPRAASTRVVRS
jgi:hypothetical protein